MTHVLPNSATTYLERPSNRLGLVTVPGHRRPFGK